MPLAEVAQDETTWQTIREWLIAAGTVGAVLVALWISVFRERSRRPKLSLHFDPTNVTDAQVVGVVAGKLRGQSIGTRAAYARLRLRNEPGKQTAEDVEILVERVRTIEAKAGQSLTPDEPLGELPLMVSNSRPLTTRLNLPPGVERHVDFLHVEKWSAGLRAGGAPMVLDVVPPPVDLRHKLLGGKVEVDLVVTARNAPARRYSVTATSDGQWGGDVDGADVWDHFHVESPRRAKSLGAHRDEPGWLGRALQRVGLGRSSA